MPPEKSSRERYSGVVHGLRKSALRNLSIPCWINQAEGVSCRSHGQNHECPVGRGVRHENRSENLVGLKPRPQSVNRQSYHSVEAIELIGMRRLAELLTGQSRHEP